MHHQGSAALFPIRCVLFVLVLVLRCCPEPGVVGAVAFTSRPFKVNGKAAAGGGGAIAGDGGGVEQIAEYQAGRSTGGAADPEEGNKEEDASVGLEAHFGVPGTY